MLDLQGYVLMKWHVFPCSDHLMFACTATSY